MTSWSGGGSTRSLRSVGIADEHEQIDSIHDDWHVVDDEGMTGT